MTSFRSNPSPELPFSQEFPQPSSQFIEIEGYPVVSTGQIGKSGWAYELRYPGFEQKPYCSDKFLVVKSPSRDWELYHQRFYPFEQKRLFSFSRKPAPSNLASIIFAEIRKRILEIKKTEKEGLFDFANSPQAEQSEQNQDLPALA